MTNIDSEGSRRAILSEQLKKLVSVDNKGDKLLKIAQALGWNDYIDILKFGGKKKDVIQLNFSKLLDDLLSRESILPTEIWDFDFEICESSGKLDLGDISSENQNINETTEESESVVEDISKVALVRQVLSDLGIKFKLAIGKDSEKKENVGKKSYIVFVLEGEKKLIFVTDSPDNATFVIHGFEEEHGHVLDITKKEEVEVLANLNKEELKNCVGLVLKGIGFVSDTNVDNRKKKYTQSLRREIELGQDILFDNNIRKIKLFFEAYKKWLGQDENTRENFNPSWLIANGFRELYRWASEEFTDKGGIRHLFDITLDYIDRHEELDLGNFKNDFNVEERTKRTDQRTEMSAVNELLGAYGEWSQLDESSRSDFGSTWLRENGYRGLYLWAQRKYNGGFKALEEKAIAYLNLFKNKE